MLLVWWWRKCVADLCERIVKAVLFGRVLSGQDQNILGHVRREEAKGERGTRCSSQGAKRYKRAP